MAKCPECAREYEEPVLFGVPVVTPGMLNDVAVALKESYGRPSTILVSARSFDLLRYMLNHECTYSTDIRGTTFVKRNGNVVAWQRVGQTTWKGEQPE